MAKQLVLEFDHECLAAALLKSQGVTEGLWRLAVKFKTGGAMGEWEEDGRTLHAPAAIAGVEKVGMIRESEPGPLTFDAAKLTDPKARKFEVDANAEPSKKKPPAKKARKA